MPGPLETQLIISADDRTAAAFASVQTKLAQLQSTISAVDRVAVPALAHTGAFAGPDAALMQHAEAVAAQAKAAGKASAAMGSAAVDAAADAVTLTASAMAMGTGVTGAAVATYEALKAGADYQSELAKLRNAGIDGDELDAADKQALALSGRYPNVGRVEAMEEYRALRSVAGRPEEVPSLMPTVIAAVSAMKALGVDTEAMPNLYKAAETLGQTRDPEKFERFIDSFVKMQQYAGHTITPETVQKFAQQMKLSGAVVSDEFIERMMFLLAQETGSRGGAGLAGAMKEFSGHIGGEEAAEWERLGFLKDDDLLHTNTGAVKGLKPGHDIANWEQALSDPDLFVWTKLIPAMEKAGVTSPLAQIKEVQTLYGNERASAIIGKLIQQEAQFKTHLANLQGVAGTAGADATLETAAVGVKSLGVQLLNLGGSLTQGLMIPIADVTSAMARALGRANIPLAQLMKGLPPEADMTPAQRAEMAEIHQREAEATRRGFEDRFPGAFGAPHTVEDIMRAPSRHALGEAYRVQAAMEADREAARGAARMTLQPLPPPLAGAPQSVSVSGAAQVEQTLHLDLHVDLDPALRARIDNLDGGSSTFTVPLSAPTGRMDNDASPLRGGTGGM